MFKGEFQQKIQVVRSASKAFLLIIIALIPFQNCGQVKLSSVMVDGALRSTNPEPTFLKPPTLDNTIFRAGFILDMSFSMQGDACVFGQVQNGSLDALDIGNPPSRATVECTSPSGVDFSMKRIKIIRKWIKDTVAMLERRETYDPQNSFKILISPFSGPQAEVQFGAGGKLREARNFLTSREALIFLAKLEYVHRCYNPMTCSINPEVDAELVPDVQEWIASSGWDMSQSILFMATSVPKPAVERLIAGVNNELINLSAQNLLSKSRFEIAMLSDGVPKPRIEHVVASAQFIWYEKNLSACVSQCSSRLREALAGGPNALNGNMSCYAGNTDCFRLLSENHIQCSANAAGVCQPPEEQICDEEHDPDGDGQCDFAGADSSISNKIRMHWGDANDNLMINIFIKLKELKNIFARRYPSVQYRQSFIRVDSEFEGLKTYEAQLDDQEINWVERTKKVFLNNYRYHLQNNTYTDVPFPLFPSMSTADSYRVKHFTAINLNSRINANKTISADSDADGLLDEVDPSPTNARSNGFCLDSVTRMMNGCVRVACDPEVDEDGDGLNDCDEKTLRTSAQDFDTDGDGIPDGIEILKGFNPLMNDKDKDENLDGLSNFNNFEQGVPPWLAPNQVDSKNLSKITISFGGYQQQTNDQGQTVQMPGYTVMLESLPLAVTRPVTESLPAYKTLAKLEDLKWDYSLTSGTHGASENTVLIIGKIENFQNPRDFYWIVKRVTIPFGSPVKILFDLQTMDYRIVPDPIWSAYD